MSKQASRDTHYRIATVIIAILSLTGIIALSVAGKGPTVEVLLSFLFGLVGAGAVVAFGYLLREASKVHGRIPWIYDSTRTAISEFALNFPEVEEVIFAGYLSKMLSEDLRGLTTIWEIPELKLLIRDLGCIEPGKPGEVPTNDKYLEMRRSQSKNSMMEFNDKTGKHKVGNITIKTYRGIPSVRGVLVKYKKNGNIGEIGFLSLYHHKDIKDGDIEAFDYTARRAKVLRMSHENSYEEALLESFKMWFESTWSIGSYDYSEDQRTNRSS